MWSFLKRLLGWESAAAPTGSPDGRGGMPPYVPRQAGEGRPGDARRPRTTSEPRESKKGAAASHRIPVTSWAYQLQDVSPARIGALDVDLVVVDYSADGSQEEAFTSADVDRMRRRPAGRRKAVIAYMSIGEAESYRYYWRKSWKGKGSKADRPAWLDRENPDWDENYKVRYWDLGWQAIILGSPEAYLDRILAAGFDGVYLDIVDAFEYYEAKRPQAAAEMITFVQRIAAYARQRRPGFLVVPQNGESLLRDAGYRATISALGKEDLLFGLEDDEEANDESEVKEALGHLELARRDGIPVLVVEYLEDKALRTKAQRRLAELGYACYCGPRDLDDIGVVTRTA